VASIAAPDMLHGVMPHVLLQRLRMAIRIRTASDGGYSEWCMTLISHHWILSSSSSFHKQVIFLWSGDILLPDGSLTSWSIHQSTMFPKAVAQEWREDARDRSVRRSPRHKQTRTWRF
jgi:hypothetical protein